MGDLSLANARNCQTLNGRHARGRLTNASASAWGDDHSRTPMLIGIVTDIHDAVRPLRATLTALRQSGVEQVVTLALAGVLGFARAADAELTIPTPELAQKIHALAEAA